MKRVGNKLSYPLCWIAIFTCFGPSNATAANGLTVNLLPSQVRPGDIVRMEVNRSSREYAEFHLEVPVIDSLHLIATEQSPVVLLDGHYTQSKTWIFQTDRSGDIAVEDATVLLVSAAGEKTVKLPPMVISVLPYEDVDANTGPLDWEESETESSGTLKTILYTLGFLLAAGLYATWDFRRRRKAKPQENQPDRQAIALSDLDKGCLNADSLHLLYACSKSDLSSELQLEIERAIYANRGNPSKLADSIRRELQL